jgi:ribosomal protein L32
MGNLDLCSWASSCGRKVRFSHATHARMRIRRIQDSGNGLSVDALAAYRCEFCGGFHIGHTRCNRQADSERRGE